MFDCSTCSWELAFYCGREEGFHHCGPRNGIRDNMNSLCNTILLSVTTVGKQ